MFHQIQYLCKNIPKVEWSGALFYTTEGEIEKPSSFKITLKTILPLDMGTAGYTEYTLDERFIDFIEEDFEERSQWKLGHIHSHNTMRVFFSGVDDAELNDNAPAHNFYLSLIVNNYMDFMAKVAFVGEAQQEIKKVPFIARNIFGDNYVIEHSDFKVDTKKLFIYNCDIISPKTEITIEEDFAKRVAKIMEPKPKPVVTSLPTTGNWQRIPNTQNFKKDYQKKSFENPFNVFDSWEKNFSNKLITDLEEDDLYTKAVYNFCMALFNVTESLFTEEETLEDVIDILNDFNLSPSDIAKAVIDSYAVTFAKHFPEATSKEFVEITNNTIDLLEEIIIIYPEVALTRKTLISMINKFIENESFSNSKI